MQDRRLVPVALLVALCVTLAAAGEAPADKGGQGKGKGPAHAAGGPGKAGKSHGKGGGPPAHSGAAKDHGKKFVDDERSAIRSYYRDAYETSGSCPPGLAKKNNGCLPPGQEARRWRVGEPLPSTVEVLPLPHDLRIRLAPPLPGYDYGYVGGEVLLFATDGRVVVDFAAVF